ncbi:MAG TPA: DegT/DnrJ/EryC1/StrS family aminotransferase [Nitrospirae bacterium]|nr:DegT/DnrJ/EryC1/StrS family aminotransferase [Nitrospirota bacterium]
MKQILAQIEELVRKYYDKLSEGQTDEIDKIFLSEPAFDSREAIGAIRTILGGWISQGPNVKKFEAAFSGYTGRDIGIAVNSGSSANLLAIQAIKEVYDLKDGDEVIVPAATFSTVVMPILQGGLTPVYVDVDRNSLNIDPSQVENAISDRTRVLMPVHTLAYPAEMPKLMEIAERNNLIVFEDCCEAHGSSIDGKRVGSFGDIASFSFFVAHNMTTGEGGMIVTNNKKLEEACRSLREFGRINQKDVIKDRYYTDDVLKDFDRRYVFDRIGYNLRMTDITAAFGIEQLAKLDEMNEQRRSNASFLSEKLMMEAGAFLDVPVEQAGYRHTYYTFPITLRENVPFSRREFAEYLEVNKIETRPLFAGCLPDQPAFRGVPGRVVGDLPNSRYLRDNLLFFGIHPGLKEKHLKYISDVILKYIKDKTEK